MPNLNNLGGYMLIDARGNFVVAGERFNLTREEELEYCANLP